MSTQRVDEGVFFDSAIAGKIWQLNRKMWFLSVQTIFTPFLFHRKVHAQLMKPWQYTVVVTLLGRRIGYRTLCNRLETIWSSTQGFSVIDLENDYYLVRFRTERDVEFALTQGP